jgi:integrase
VANRKGGVILGHSYLVTIPAVYSEHGRVRKQFKSKEAAKLFASLTFEGIRKVGVSFTRVAKEDFARVVTMLSGGYKKSLEDVCNELAERKAKMLEQGHIRSITARTFRSSLDRIIREIGGSKISEIGIKFTVDWITNFEGSTRTKRNYLNTLSEVLNFGVYREYISDNPIKKLPKTERARICGPRSEAGIAILKVSEAEKLLRVAKQRTDLGMINAVCLGLFCGIRTEELKKLSWEHVDLKNEVIKITSDIAKKRSIRYVSIPKNAISWLEPGSGRIVESNYASHFNHKLSKLVDLSHIIWAKNVMRHSFASYHYALGGDSKSTSRQLGHRQGDHVLFTHYRNLVRHSDAVAYFGITYG